VGNSGTILTSSDGTSWDNRTSGTSYGLHKVFYAYVNSKSIYMVAGDAGIFLTSSDGTTCTTRASGTTETLHGIAYKE
jgi:photosystem II stability/assembly factor-like uncharacterized protein